MTSGSVLANLQPSQGIYVVSDGTEAARTFAHQQNRTKLPSEPDTHPHEIIDFDDH